MEDNSFLQQYKTREELEQYCIAQQKVLVQLNKKIRGLEQELESMKNQAKSFPRLVSSQNEEVQQSVLNSSPEEMIAREQIFLLKQVSSSREMTFEEAKKLDIYTKILQTVAFTNNKKQEKEVVKLSTDELLKLAEGNDSNPK